MSTRRPKSKNKHAGDAQAFEDAVMADPYVAISSPLTVCSSEDHTKRKNCSRNPWCLYGLGERDGIWKQNSTQLIATLGEDPSIHLRSMHEEENVGKLMPPAGLKNLGATCYLNVLIQSLFHNLLVQDAVLNMESTKSSPGTESSSDETMRKVITELQRTFTSLKLCRYGVTDLSRFVDLLGLQKNVQQDPQEFNKLFLSKLESLECKVKDKSRVLFNDLLGGKIKYCTRCLGCKQERAPPEHDFHELDLSIDGVKSVEEALARYLTVEELRGDNKYDCSSCGGLRDADRATIISKTPIMLCLHLLRYDYDRITYERKKLTTEVTYPDRLELCGEEFKLTAVLYHKGRSAHGGHYVCDALDWETENWWHYDDDTVKITNNPALSMLPSIISDSAGNQEQAEAVEIIEIDEAADSCDDSEYNVEEEDEMGGEGAGKGKGSNSKSKKRRMKPTKGGLVDTMTDGGGDGTVKKRKTGENKKKTPVKNFVAVDLTDPAVDSKNGIETVASTAGVKVSVNRRRDAYMLTYVKVADFERCLQIKRCDPPGKLIEDVEEASAAYIHKVEFYESQKAKLLAEVEERKRLYNSIKHSLAPSLPQYDAVVDAAGDGSIPLADSQLNFQIVPADWLQKWIRGDPSTFQTILSARKSGPSFNSVLPSTGCDVGSIDNDDDDDIIILDSAPQKGGSSFTNKSATTQPANQDPGFVPMRCMLCPHERGLSATFQEKVKLLSERAYNVIFQSNDSWQQLDVSISHETYRCGQCCEGLLSQRVAVHSQASQNDKILKYIDYPDRYAVTVLEEPEDEINSTYYWLSKKWLTEFRKLTATLHRAETSKAASPPLAKIFVNSRVTKKNSVDVDAGGSSSAGNDVEIEDVDAEVSEIPPGAAVGTLDPKVNTGLYCEHGNPSLHFNKRGIKVSRMAWRAILELFPSALTLENERIACPQCERESKNQADQLQTARDMRQQEVADREMVNLFKIKRIYPAVLDEDTEPIDCESDSKSNSCSDTQTHSEHQIAAAHGPFYAIEGKWLAHWRSYIAQPNFPVPPSLTNEKLRCIHGGAYLPTVLSAIALGIKPKQHETTNLQVYKFQEEDLGASEQEERYFQVVGKSRTAVLPVAEVISEKQWQILLQYHGAVPTASTKFKSNIVNLEDDEDNSNEGNDEKDERLGTRFHANSAALSEEDDTSRHSNAFCCRLLFDSKHGSWNWDPEVCQECLSSYEAQSHAAKIDFSCTSLPVVLLRDESEYLNVFNKKYPGQQPSGVDVVEVNGESVPPRTSARTRNRRKNSTIIADSSDTLSIVRLKICQAFFGIELPPNQQKLFNNKGDVLVGNGTSLFECDVKVGDTIYVMQCTDSSDSGGGGGSGDVESGGAGSGGDWSYLDYYHGSSARALETGFRGTFLQGSSAGSSSASLAATVVEATGHAGVGSLPASSSASASSAKGTDSGDDHGGMDDSGLHNTSNNSIIDGKRKCGNSEEDDVELVIESPHTKKARGKIVSLSPKALRKMGPLVCSKIRSSINGGNIEQPIDIIDIMDSP